MSDIASTINAALKKAGLLGSTNQTSYAHAVQRRSARLMNAVNARPTAEKGSDGMRNATLSNSSGTRNYLLFLPDVHVPGHSYPLILMLHGCTQTPEDFAAGTAMNDIAQRLGIAVAYPEQSSSANGSRCWNWFRRQDQSRDKGEPAILADITRRIIADQPIDPKRVYVGGLSAGASMAVIMGRLYPELFAAVGSHSGLPFASAHDAPSAFAAMQDGNIDARTTSQPSSISKMPTIAFHGISDCTVSPHNSDRIIDEAVSAYGHLTAQTTTVVTPGRQSSERTLFHDGDSHVRVAHWKLHGVGHAWSGGQTSGTHTAPAGIDASEEMVRFFLLQTN